MEKRTPEEELEYRRYLRRRIRMRKRRRQVMIARTILVIVSLVIVFFIFYGIGKLTGPIGGNDAKKVEDSAKKPEKTPFVVDIPEGYESIYSKLFAKKEEHPEIEDILMNLEQYPKDVLRLLIRNDETLEFVSNYPKHIDDEVVQGSITEQELEQTIPLFQQWDQRWGYVHYSDNIIAINGCGPTCMSMVYTGLTGNTDMTPADVADFCVEHNYYTQDSGTSWALMADGAQKLGLQAEKLTVSKDVIKEKLKTEQPIICSMKPGDFTQTGHFIVLYGLSEDGKILLNDPNSISRSEKEWKFETILNQIKAAWSYAYMG